MEGDTAQRIMQVAHNLLAERGFSAFSFADISEAVGIRNASIHHHFPTKTALVVAVLAQHRQRMEEGQATLDQMFASPAERLEKYVAHWESCIRKQTDPICIAALLGAELPGLPPEIQASVKEHFTCLHDWVVKTLKLGMKQSVFQLQNKVDIEAELLMAAIHGAMISARVNHSSLLFKQLTHSALQRLHQN